MEQPLWYFAYGSMVNPVSLRRRGIIPEESAPGVLSGYSLGFQLGGMANLVSCSVSDSSGSSVSCHGILHKITPAMFDTLRAVETYYDVAEVQVTAYQPCFDNASTKSNNSCNSSGTVVNLAEDTASKCAVSIGSVHNSSSSNEITHPSSVETSAVVIDAKTFIVPQEHLTALQQKHPEWVPSLPTERYITIITKGLQHYGADPSWIQGVAATPFTPNKTIEQYEQIPSPAASASLHTFTAKELAAFRGKIIDGKAISAIGSKVIEIDLSGDENSPYATIVKVHMTGHDHTYNLCMNLYDPGLPELHSPEDLTDAHRAWAEDQCMQWTRKNNSTLRQIGWLATEAPTDKGQQASQAPAECSH